MKTINYSKLCISVLQDNSIHLSYPVTPVNRQSKIDAGIVGRSAGR
jgi:hypothetical protein